MLKTEKKTNKFLVKAAECFLILVLTLTVVFGQKEESAKRGLQTGALYSISDIESINNTNGNVMFNIPLASLPAGRSNFGYGISLTYNSKMWDTLSEPVFITPPNSTARATLLMKSDNAGWRYGYNYKFEQKQRPGIPAQPGNPYSACYGQGDPNYSYVDIYKFVMTFPDGSSHEFKPSRLYISDIYTQETDNYHAVDINGTHRRYRDVVSNLDNTWLGCEVQLHPYTGGMNFHTTDGSNLRLFVAHDNDNNPANNFWTLRMPDGSRITNNEPLPGGGTAQQRIYDRNGNFVEITESPQNSNPRLIQATDRLGRSLTVSQNSQTREDTITSVGFDNEQLTWTVKWKAVGVSRQYKIDTEEWRNEFSAATASGVFQVIDEIMLPSQIGGQKYEFEYNGNSNGNVNSYSEGFGEIKQVKLPAGAMVDYEYALDGMQTTVSSWQTVMHNPVKLKTLAYQTAHDGVTETISENWTYNIGRGSSTITAPDGSTSQAGYSDVYEGGDGLVKTTSTNNSITTKEFFQFPSETGVYPYNLNKPYKHLAKIEHTTLKDAAGNPYLTAIKEFGYDLNGNLLKVKEYDWVPFSSITYNQYGQFIIPSNAVLKRITVNEYYNATPELLSGQTLTNNEFYTVGSPNLLNAVKSIEIRDGSGTTISRTEFVYDNTSIPIKGNLTQTRVWDSHKNGVNQPYSNPLTEGNSVSSTVVYDQYGNPTLMTDAKGNQTQITYGDIITPTGTVNGLYPTQTVSAYGTPIAQTTTAEYDFHTGLVKKTTALGNTAAENVVSETEYDALGRPVKSKAAVGTPLEIWTTTEYDDINRRVITRSDIEAKGDGKRIAVQHFDQLGRVRLTRRIENVLTEDPYNEQHGIKVQTRYKYHNPTNPAGSNGEYVLTSTPYRAATSQQAANEPTMGWKVEYEDKTGNLSTSETFSGAAMPSLWGNNTNSTGIAKEEEIANTTITTDEAGKKRRLVEDALGNVIRVDEPNNSGELGAAANPNQATNYSYDARGNLIQILQGGQTRTFTYSSLNRLLTATNPESGTFQYSYDNNGNLLTKSDARAVTTTYSYDALNRVLFRDYSDATPDITYTYDDSQVPNSKGKLTKVSSSVSEMRYTAFDKEDRLLSSQQITDGKNYDFAYTYNLNGDLATQTYPSGKIVRYDYDASGDLARVSGQTGQIERTYAGNFIYAPHGKVEKLRLGNGRWETTSFNAALQIKQIGLGHSLSDTGLWKADYEYGDWENGAINPLKNNGNLARQTISVPTIGAAVGFTAVQTYTYDSLDRLKSATEKVGGVDKWKQTFLYDRFGNRNFDTSNNNTTLQSVESNVPKIVNPEVLPANNKYKQDQDNDGIDDYLYDASGNLTKDAKGRTFTYDAENRQTAAVGNDLSVSYAYDGNGKRVKSHNAVTNQTTVFVYDGEGDLAAEYTINTPAPQNPTTSYLTEDALGSVRVTTDSAGQIKARRDFLPFGEELYAGIGNRTTNQKYSASGDDTRKKFATYQRDIETGLDFAQSRYYSPLQGRFTSPDEFKGGPDELFDFEEDASDNPTFYAELDNPQSFNKYQYTYNNPYKYNDPSGHCPKCWVAAEIALTIWDVVETVKTFRDPNASTAEKMATAGGTVLGIIAPGGGYGVAGKAIVKTAKGSATKTATQTVSSKASSSVSNGAKKTVKRKEFSPKTREQISNRNKARNGGKETCENCGVRTVKPKKSTRGVTPNRRERQYDHKKSASSGGSNSSRNGRILCRGCNRDRSNNGSNWDRDNKYKNKYRIPNQKD